MKRYPGKLISTENKKNTRGAVFYIILTIAVILAIYFLGIPALGRLTSFVSSMKGNDKKISSSDITPPPPPKFKNFPEFTNQTTLSLSGNTEAGSTVKLIFNGIPSEVISDSDGQFSFTVDLQNGINTFAATATDQSGNQSQKSEDYKITFDNKAPELTVSSPNDGSSFFGSNQRQVTIQGQTEPDASVTINDRIIFVDDTGNFQYTTTLNEGSNNFNIKATDKAGNTTEKTISLNFSS